MNKQNLNSFIMDIEKMHKAVNNDEIKSHLCTQFQNIKEKHLPEKEKSKPNIYEEVKKMLYNSRGETAEVVAVDIEKFKTKCDDSIRVERIKLVNQKLKNIEGEPLMISSLKGYLLFQHKNAIGVKKFYEFFSDTEENHDYALFLIRFYKLMQKYKKLQ